MNQPVTAEVVEVPISVSGIEPLRDISNAEKFADASPYIHVAYEGDYFCAICGFRPPKWGSNPAMVSHLKDSHGIAPPDGKWWWISCYYNHRILMALEHWERSGRPASTAAPEPDWVAVLCGMGYAPQFSVNRDKTQYVCLAYADGTDPKCLFESATGPTPALAAKACVERLRAGGAT